MMLDLIIKKIKYAFLQLRRCIPDFPLKIIAVTGNPSNKNVKIHYQISGKSTIAEDTPKNLIHNLIQIQGFSKESSKLILEIFKEQLVEPDFAIRNIIFSASQDEFEIKDIQNNYIMKLTASQIFESSSLIKKLSAQDLKIIFYSLVNQHKYVEKLWRAQKYSKSKKTNLYVIND